MSDTEKMIDNIDQALAEQEKSLRAEVETRNALISEPEAMPEPIPEEDDFVEINPWEDVYKPRARERRQKRRGEEVSLPYDENAPRPRQRVIEHRERQEEKRLQKKREKEKSRKASQEAAAEAVDDLTLWEEEGSGRKLTRREERRKRIIEEAMANDDPYSREWLTPDETRAIEHREELRRKRTGKKPKKRRRPGRIVLLVIIIIIAALVASGIGLYMTGKNSLVESNISAVEQRAPEGAGASGGALSYNGETYHYNDNLINMLVFGVGEEVSADGTERLAATGIFIWSYDTESKKTNLIAVPGHMMSGCPVYDDNNEFVHMNDQQIGASYASGGTTELRRYQNVATSVSNLFYGLPISGYLVIDMTKIGFTVNQIRSLLQSRQYINEAPVLTVGGERQTIARYPNSDWLNIGARSTMIDQYGNPTMATDNEGGEFEAVSYEIEYGEEHMEHTLSWHSLTYVRAAGHYNVLWVQDLGDKLSFIKDDNIMTVPYYGGYAPKEGGLLYWYNIPEELDIPGEYYIDENAILYYYPADDFDTADISLPLADGFVRLDNTDYITFENIAFESCLQSGITGTSDYLTIKDCDISAIVGEKAIQITGYNVLIQGNHIHNLSQGGISLQSGDLKTLTQSNSRVYNNYIHDWGITKYPYADGIAVEGVGILVDHNILTSSNAAGISGEGAYVIVEYNHIGNILRTSDDIGAVGNSGLVDNITRYNYIHNIGSVGAAAEVEALNDYGSAGIYWDGGSSFAEAYGNVIQTIKGHGVIMNGGRGLKVHGNLIIDCTKWYVQCVAMFYARALDSGFSEYKDVYPDYVNSAVWVKANPELSKIVEDLSKTTSDDPMAWCTTYGDELYNNWIHYNKASATITNWGTRPYWVEDHVYTFSPDTIQVAKDGVDSARTSVYTSRRQKVSIEDLITNKAAGTIEITWEQFNNIGIVLDDWNFDIELPALIAE